RSSIPKGIYDLVDCQTLDADLIWAIGIEPAAIEKVDKSLIVEVVSMDLGSSQIPTQHLPSCPHRRTSHASHTRLSSRTRQLFRVNPKYGFSLTNVIESTKVARTTLLCTLCTSRTLSCKAPLYCGP
ncbi:hypothetical protein PIB30_095923, partial [Stylosanthes scabra]|nr:hypothetical protein [Stylosanthes scabra]